MDTIETISMITILLVVLLIWPLCIYGITLYIRNKKEPFIYKRCPTSLVYITLWIVYGMVLKPIELMLETAGIQMDRNTFYGYTLSLGFICLLSAILYCGNVFVHSIINQQNVEWRRLLLLSPSFSNDNSNLENPIKFIMNNKLFLINRKLQIISTFAIYAAIMICYIVIVRFCDFLIGVIYMVAWFSVLIVASGILCTYITRFIDFWHLYREWTIAISLGIIAMPFYMLGLYVIFVQDNFRLGKLIVNICVIVEGVAFVFTSTIAVVYWNLRRKKLLLQGSKNKNNKSNNINQLVESLEGFELFMKHLMKEYSVENMLYLCELSDLQLLLFENNLLSKDDVSAYLVNLKIPFNTSKSQVIKQYDQNSNCSHFPPLLNANSATNSNNVVSTSNLTIEINNNWNDIINIYKYLYEKYIQPNKAPLEINLSFGARFKLQKHYDIMASNDHDNINWKLFFDDLRDSATEIKLLLNHSVSRFNLLSNLYS